MKKLSIKISLVLSILMGAFSASAQTLADGIKMLQYERFESAKKILTPLATTSEDANYYLGLTELTLGNTKEASAIFAKYPESKANISGMARVLFADKNKTEAMALLNGLVKKAKRKELASVMKLAADAITYSSGGDLTQAVDWYTKSNELAESAETYLALGDAHNDMPGGGGKAMSRWEDAAAKMQNPSLAYFKMGQLWYEAKNYDSAIALYNRASSVDPENPLPYRRFADSYYKINKYTLAKQNIEKYLKVSDNSIDDQLYYLNILYLGNETDLALNKIKELFAKGIDKPYMYRLQGYLHLQKGMYAEALASMDKFFAKVPVDKTIPMDYTSYAKILMNTPGREAEANTFLQKSIDVDTSSDKSTAYRTLAEDFKNNNDYKNAAIWYNKLVTNFPASAQMLDYYYGGYANYYIDDYATATDQFKKLEEIYPEDPTGILWQAKVAVAQDLNSKTGIAAPLYEKYLAQIGDKTADNLAEVTKAYEYLALYNYNAKKVADAKKYNALLLKTDASNEIGKKLADVLVKM